MKKGKPELLRDKPPAPESLVTAIEKAKARAQTRRVGPPLLMKRGDNGELVWDWPYDEESGEDPKPWIYLLLDAFGTRYLLVAAVFVNQLLDLCTGATFNEDRQEWEPEEAELIQLLHIVNATKPKNEAQAALAAQIAATHMITMKVAKRAADYPYDTRTIGSYAKLAQASAVQFAALATLQGKRRTTRQSITVRHEKHVHHHQHVHLEGGASENVSQAHTPADGATEQFSALPSQDETGRVVPLASRQGQARLSDARRSKGNGRAKG